MLDMAPSAPVVPEHLKAPELAQVDRKPSVPRSKDVDIEEEYVEEPTEIVDAGLMSSKFLQKVARILFEASNLKCAPKGKLSGAATEVPDDSVIGAYFLEKLSKIVAEVRALKSLPATLTLDDGTVVENKYRVPGEDYVEIQGFEDSTAVSAVFLDKLAQIVYEASSIGSPPKDHEARLRELDDVESNHDTSRVLDDSLLTPHHLGIEEEVGNLKLDDSGKDTSDISCKEVGGAKGDTSENVIDISISEKPHIKAERSEYKIMRRERGEVLEPRADDVSKAFTSGADDQIIPSSGKKPDSVAKVRGFGDLPFLLC